MYAWVQPFQISKYATVLTSAFQFVKKSGLLLNCVHYWHTVVFLIAIHTYGAGVE